MSSSLWVFLLLAGTNGLLLPPTPAPAGPTTVTERIPVICLKNVELAYNESDYTRVNVVCIYDDEDIGNMGLEYPEPEKLALPDPRKCFERTLHLKSPAGVHYYASWMDGKSEESWIDARNFCRKMCLDLVSLETLAENTWIKEYIEKKKIQEVWTSGRLCDFRGCEYYRSPYMWPRDENGWFWAGSGVRIAPSYDATRTDWAFKGPFKNDRQPDNRAHQRTGKTESCIAILNNRYMDGIHWHDELCELKMPFICEENQLMLEEAKKDPAFS